MPEQETQKGLVASRRSRRHATGYSNSTNPSTTSHGPEGQTTLLVEKIRDAALPHNKLPRGGDTARSSAKVPLYSSSTYPAIPSNKELAPEATVTRLHDKLLFGHKEHFVSKLFNAYDSQRTGTLSYDQFLAALDRMQTGLSDTDKRVVLAKADPAGTGQVNYRVFLDDLSMPRSLGDPGDDRAIGLKPLWQNRKSQHRFRSWNLGPGGGNRAAQAKLLPGMGYMEEMEAAMDAAAAMEEDVGDAGGGGSQILATSLSHRSGEIGSGAAAETTGTWGSSSTNPKMGFPKEEKVSAYSRQAEDAWLMDLAAGKIQQHRDAIQRRLRARDPERCGRLGKKDFMAVLCGLKTSLAPRQIARIYDIAADAADGSCISYERFLESFDVGRGAKIKLKGLRPPVLDGADAAGNPSPNTAAASLHNGGGGSTRWGAVMRNLGPYDVSSALSSPLVAELRRRVYARGDGQGFQSLFHLYDPNGDGIVSLDDLTKGCQMIVDGIDKKTVAALMLDLRGQAVATAGKSSPGVFSSGASTIAYSDSGSFAGSLGAGTNAGARASQLRGGISNLSNAYSTKGIFSIGDNSVSAYLSGAAGALTDRCGSTTGSALSVTGGGASHLAASTGLVLDGYVNYRDFLKRLSNDYVAGQAATGPLPVSVRAAAAAAAVSSTLDAQLPPFDSGVSARFSSPIRLIRDGQATASGSQTHDYEAAGIGNSYDAPPAASESVAGQSLSNYTNVVYSMSPSALAAVPPSSSGVIPGSRTPLPGRVKTEREDEVSKLLSFYAGVDLGEAASGAGGSLLGRSNWGDSMIWTKPTPPVPMWHLAQGTAAYNAAADPASSPHVSPSAAASSSQRLWAWGTASASARSQEESSKAAYGGGGEAGLGSMSSPTEGGGCSSPVNNNNASKGVSFGFNQSMNVADAAGSFASSPKRRGAASATTSVGGSSYKSEYAHVNQLLESPMPEAVSTRGSGVSSARFVHLRHPDTRQLIAPAMDTAGFAAPGSGMVKKTSDTFLQFQQEDRERRERAAEQNKQRFEAKARIEAAKSARDDACGDDLPRLRAKRDIRDRYQEQAELCNESRTTDNQRLRSMFGKHTVFLEHLREGHNSPLRTFW